MKGRGKDTIDKGGKATREQRVNWHAPPSNKLNREITRLAIDRALAALARRLRKRERVQLALPESFTTRIVKGVAADVMSLEKGGEKIEMILVAEMIARERRKIMREKHVPEQFQGSIQNDVRGALGQFVFHHWIYGNWARACDNMTLVEADSCDAEIDGHTVDVKAPTAHELQVNLNQLKKPKDFYVYVGIVQKEDGVWTEGYIHREHCVASKEQVAAADTVKLRFSPAKVLSIEQLNPINTLLGLQPSDETEANKLRTLMDYASDEHHGPKS